MKRANGGADGLADLCSHLEKFIAALSKSDGMVSIVNRWNPQRHCDALLDAKRSDGCRTCRKHSKSGSGTAEGLVGYVL